MPQVRFTPDPTQEKPKVRFTPTDENGNPIPTPPASDFTLTPKSSGTISEAPSTATYLYREAKARGKSLLDSVKELGGGIVSGAANTGLSASHLVNRATGGRLGVSQDTTLADIGMEPKTELGKAGMGMEQFAEFFVPEGAIGKGGKAVEAATAGIRGNRLLDLVRGGINLGAKSGMEALSAGSIAGLHGEDPTAPAIAGAIGPAVSEVAGHYAPKIYRAALKPSTTYSPAQVDELIDTGLKEGIPVSRRGRQKLTDIVEAMNARVRGMLDPNVLINPSDIAARTQPLESTYGKFHQVNPESDLSSIASSREEFLRQHQIPARPAVPAQPTGLLDQYGNPIMSQGAPAIHARDIPIPSPKVHDIKTGTYRQVSWKKGTPHQLAPATEASQKAMARGAKEELEAKFPGIKDLNAREGRALTLAEAMDRATNRIENRDVIGIGAPIASMAASAAGAPGGLVGLAKLLPPSITSRLAIEMAKKRAISPFMAALTGAMQRRQ